MNTFNLTKKHYLQPILRDGRPLQNLSVSTWTPAPNEAYFYLYHDNTVGLTETVPLSLSQAHELAILLKDFLERNGVNL